MSLNWSESREKGEGRRENLLFGPEVFEFSLLPSPFSLDSDQFFNDLPSPRAKCAKVIMQ